MSELLFPSVVVSAMVGIALFLSNVLYSVTQNFVYSRKLAHAISGLAILSTLWLFDTPLVPVILASSLLVVLAATHRREVFYGVQRKGRLSEVYFALSAVVCLASGWFISREIGVAAALFMAWGDGATGLARWMYNKKHAKTWPGTVTNLVVCSLIALMIVPYWVGLVGAVVATVLEHLCGDVGRVRWLDDNLSSPLGALGVMVLLLAL